MRTVTLDSVDLKTTNKKANGNKKMENVVEILPNKIKAWKKHKEQTQNITVPIGEIILVVYDDRKGSNTQNNIIVTKIFIKAMLK